MFTQGLISDTIGWIYECPASTFAQVKTIKIYNYSNNDCTVFLFSRTTGIRIQYDSFLMEAGSAIEISPSYPLEYTSGLSSPQGIEALASLPNSVHYFIGGRERAI